MQQKEIKPYKTDQSFWDIPADGAEVSNDEGHQVCAHIDGCLFKLILQEAVGELSGFGLKAASIHIKSQKYIFAWCNQKFNL